MAKKIEIVIKISEEVYNKIREGGFWLESGLQLSDAYDAIKYGTPLPKEHGRLIDADALIVSNEEYRFREPYSEADEMRNRMIDYINEDIHDAPTIIEADKEK